MSSIDKRIRIAIFETAIDIALLKKKKSVKRTARNILEIGCSLCKKNISETAKKDIYNDLLNLIPLNDPASLKKYLLEKFV